MLCHLLPSVANGHLWAETTHLMPQKSQWWPLMMMDPGWVTHQSWVTQHHCRQTSDICRTRSLYICKCSHLKPSSSSSKHHRHHKNHDQHHHCCYHHCHHHYHHNTYGCYIVNSSFCWPVSRVIFRYTLTSNTPLDEKLCHFRSKKFPKFPR